jgi:hypothetical protein
MYKFSGDRSQAPKLKPWEDVSIFDLSPSEMLLCTHTREPLLYVAHNALVDVGDVLPLYALLTIKFALLSSTVSAGQLCCRSCSSNGK